MIYNLEEAIGKIKEHRAKNEKIVFTNGCFDIIHAGHVKYLNIAKSYGDILVVGLNSDDSIKRIKGEKRPIVPQEQRAYVLSQLKPVDMVIIFDEDTPYNLIKAIKPDILIKGADWKIENIVGADIVLSNGGSVNTVKFDYDTSTSKIIQKIVELYCEKP
ncbi:D-glycero-beta-D-manno-heptose 1-phosphate adenylyltransferase [Hydrogenobaculum acidophilum]